MTHGYYSKKQINAIYAANKRGDIQVSDQLISTLYNVYAERSIPQDFYNNNTLECGYLTDAIDAIFANDYAKAQDALNKLDPQAAPKSDAEDEVTDERIELVHGYYVSRRAGSDFGTVHEDNGYKVGWMDLYDFNLNRDDFGLAGDAVYADVEAAVIAIAYPR